MGLPRRRKQLHRRERVAHLAGLVAAIHVVAEAELAADITPQHFAEPSSRRAHP